MERREQGHLVVRVGLEVHNLKTNEKYRSRISLVELASPEKLYSSEAKAANAVSKCLVAFGNREKLVPCREHRLTQVLKDSFNANVHCANPEQNHGYRQHGRMDEQGGSAPGNRLCGELSKEGGRRGGQTQVHFSQKYMTSCIL